MAKYSMDQIRVWAERYMVLLSFRAVGKEFGVDGKTILAKLKQHKEELGLKFGEEIREEQIKQWAERYKILLSFRAVGREFDVASSVIKANLMRHKDEIGLRLREEIGQDPSIVEINVCAECHLCKNTSEFGRTETLERIKKKCLYCERLHREEYRSTNKDSISAKRRAERQTPAAIEKRRARVIASKDKINARDRERRRENIEAELAKERRYAHDNRDRINARRRTNKARDKRAEYQRNKMRTDINYRIAEQLRGRLSSAVKNGLRGGSAIRDLGCSIEEAKIWLESQFYISPITGEKMTWDNWSLNGWHIDHILPLASFDLTDSKQVRKACNWFNLRPLWAQENLSKGAKIEETSDVA